MSIVLFMIIREFDLFRIRSPMYTLYKVYTLYSEHCTLYNDTYKVLQLMMNMIYCATYTIRCIVYTGTLYTVLHTLYGIYVRLGIK